MLERRINIVRHRKYSIAFKRDIGIKNRIVVSHAITKVPNPFHCGANFATTSGIRQRALQTEAPELVVAFSEHSSPKSEMQVRGYLLPRISVVGT